MDYEFHTSTICLCQIDTVDAAISMIYSYPDTPHMFLGIQGHRKSDAFQAGQPSEVGGLRGEWMRTVN